MNERYGYSERQWQRLHEEIQDRFRAAAEQVKAAAPSLDLAYGKTVTPLFPLFSFVRFKPGKHSGREDTLMGIELVPVGSQWRLDADVSTEESGEIFFELPNPAFSVSSFEEFRDRVLRAADQLASSGRPVLLRLFGTNTPGVPSPNPTAPHLAGKT